jgi:hypothetical protein
VRIKQPIRIRMYVCVCVVAVLFLCKVDDRLTYLHSRL